MKKHLKRNILFFALVITLAFSNFTVSLAIDNAPPSITGFSGGFEVVQGEQFKLPGTITSPTSLFKVTINVVGEDWKTESFSKNLKNTTIFDMNAFQVNTKSKRGTYTISVWAKSDGYPEPTSELGRITLTVKSKAGFIWLATKGPGYVYDCTNADHHWGTYYTINTLKEVAKKWSQNHSSVIRIGDISLPQGGYFSPHNSHKSGVEVDIALIDNNGKLCTIYKNKNYNQAEEVEFVKLLRNYNISVIYFNDPVLIGQGLVEKCSGHDNHIHVKFY